MQIYQRHPDAVASALGIGFMVLKALMVVLIIGVLSAIATSDLPSETATGESTSG